MSNVIRVDSDYKIQVIGGGTITLDTGTSGTVLVTGNLDVKGSNTAITSSFVVEDNILTINYGEEGSSISEGAGGIEIVRGTNIDGNASILFDESLTWNDPVTNTIKNGLFVFRTEVGGINGIRTNSINTDGGDLFLINDGLGKVSVSGTVDYENQITDDDDIPNKKYVDDLVANTLAFGQSTGIADGNTFIQVLDNSSYAGVSKAIVSINSTEVANFQDSQIDFFNLRFSGTKIETTLSNADIFLTIPGTGTINLQANAEVTDNFTVIGTSTLADVSVNNTATINTLVVTGTSTVDNINVLGNAAITGNATITGDLSVSGNYYINGISVVDNVEITGNTIQNIVTNNDLNLTTVGTGVVRVLSSLTVDNNVIITGNLTVNGSTTTVNSTTLTVDDKNIELASTASPTDTLADGGGITLRGTTDKTILYNNTNGRWETNIGLTVGGALSVTPLDASVTLSPTGTGTVTVNPATTGSINNVNIGASTRGTGAFTSLDANGNVTLGDADTDTITVGGAFVTGTVLRSAKSNGNTLAIAAYDVDGSTYTNLITLTASNTPTIAITSSGVGSLDNINIGGTTRGTGAFTTLAANGNVTLGDADTDTITVGASFVTGTVLRSAKADTNTLALAAYDVDGAAYTNLITLTASNTPTLTITSTGVGSINNMNIGASTRGTGAFTTLDANSTVTLSPANTTVTISPSGTGSVTIAPATTLTLGTSGQTTTMNGTTITMANATGVAINGANPTISSTSTGTLTLFNANIATVNAFQGATVISMGATTGTMTLRNAVVALSGSGTMVTQGTTNDSITRKDYVDSMAIAMTVALSVL